MRGGILLAVALGGLALMAWHFVPQPDAPPAIGRVDVVGAERLSPTRVRSVSGLQVGAPWTAQAKRQAINELTHLPQARSVKIDDVSRFSQADQAYVSIRVEVDERRPYGIVQLSGGDRHWVGRDGVLLEPVDRQPPSLPVLLGVSPTSSPEGSRLRSAASVRVMRSLYALNGERLRRIASLRFRGYDLVLRLREEGRALLPPQGLPAQMQRLERVMATLRERGDPGWRTLDLRVPGEVAIGR